MAKKSRIRKLTVRIGYESLEKASDLGAEGGTEKQGKDKGVERFILPMLRPFQLQPLPIETNVPRVVPGHNVKELRQLLSDEKARILATIKNRKPQSLYKLAKLLGRDFKAVRGDVKLLEKVGFIKLVHDKDPKTKKKRLKPLLAIDKLQIVVEF